MHVIALQAPLEETGLERAGTLLTYGPRYGLPERKGELVGTVVPRLGTISPWSSKATDIFKICGLDKVLRVERGVRWYVVGATDTSALKSALYDRMTERIVS